MRVILTTIAFVMLATPSWGGETDISFFDKINNSAYLMNESVEFKITLDLFAFLLMFAFFAHFMFWFLGFLFGYQEKYLI